MLAGSSNMRLWTSLRQLLASHITAWTIESLISIASPSSYLSTAFICPAVGEHPYYGKLIANNWGAGASNGLSGQVYAVNKDSFQVIGFTFDGAADGQ